MFMLQFDIGVNLVFFTSRTFGNFSCFATIYSSFSCFLNFFCLGENKQVYCVCVLHIASYHYYPLGRNSFILRLFQHVMSFTYEHVLSNSASYEYADIVQDIVNRGVNVNTKGENGKLPLHLACTKQL